MARGTSALRNRVLNEREDTMNNTRTGQYSCERVYASRAEIADILGINVRTVERLEYRGELRAYKIAGCVRYKVADVRRWAESRER